MNKRDIVKLYTPNHNPLTDTLIMWGLTRIITSVDLCNDRDSWVIGEGSRYVFELSGCNKKELENVDILESEKYLANIIEANKISVDSQTPKLIKKFVFGLDNNTKGGLRKILQKSGRMINLTVYADSDHKNKYKENRRGSSSNITIYIPISGVYGKYETRPHSYVDKPYKVCRECVLTSIIGLLNAASIVSKKSGRGNLVYYNILGFTGKTELRKISQVITSNWFSSGEAALIKAMRNDASLTELSQVFTYALYTPDTFPSELSWFMYTYSYDIGSTKRINTFKSFDYSLMLDYTIRLKEIYPHIIELIEWLLSSKEAVDAGADTVINTLSELAYNNNAFNVYLTVRELRKVIKKLTKSSERSKSIGEELRRLLNIDLAVALISGTE